jgi:hypothetical protein
MQRRTHLTETEHLSPDLKQVGDGFEDEYSRPYQEHVWDNPRVTADQ